MKPISRRSVLTVVLGGVACLWAAASFDCIGLHSGDSRGSTLSRLAPPTRPGSSQPTIAGLQPSVEERLASIDGRFRLEPDRRALHAVVELERLLNAQDAPAEGALPTRVYDAARWEIRIGERAVGTLPAMPAFHHLLDLLDARVNAASAQALGPKLASQSGAGDTDVERLGAFDDRAVFDRLARIDARWSAGKASVADLRQAAHALAELSLLLADDFELADFLHGRALAVLALARRHGHSEVVRAECMLALAMGYSSHAKSLEPALRAGDPLIAYMHRDVASLRSDASRSDKPEARFFYGSALSLQSNVVEWTEWLDSLGSDAWSLSLLRAFSNDPDLNTSRWLPDLIIVRILQMLDLEISSDDTKEVFSRADQLEAKLGRRASSFSGPIATPALYRAFYRALIFNAFAQKIDFYDRILSSRPALLELAHSLAQTPDADVAVVGQFAEMRARLEVDSPSTSRGWALFENPSVLGPEQRIQISYELARAIRVPSGEGQELADAAVALLDSRPKHLALGLWFAESISKDAGNLQRLQETLVADDVLNREPLRVELAAKRGDRDELWRLLDQDSLTPRARLRVLKEIQKLEGFDRERMIQHYEEEIARPETLYAAFEDYASLLSKENHHTEAQRVWKKFFDRAESFRGIEQAYATAEMAQELRLDGKPELGWKWLEPELDGYVGHVLGEAVRTQVALGNLEQAEQIARRAVDRYPSNWPCIAQLASVLWRRGRFADAATLIARSPDRSTSWASSEVARYFATVHGETGGPEMVAAFKALVEQGFDYDFLEAIVDRLREQGKPEFAFELGNLIHDSDRQILLYTQSYKSLAQARGEAEALEWLGSVLPRSWLNKSPKIFYTAEAYELLWTLTADPGSDRDGQEAWLLRAAAHVRQKATNVERRAALLEYYANHDSTFSDRLGGALMGLRTGNDVLRSARNESELCLAASFLGLQAEMEARLEEAARLYQLALTTPPSDTVAYYTLPGALQRLMDRWGRLDREAKQS